MYNDYLKVLNCINSSETANHILVCEKLCELFKIKWFKEQTSILYYDKLILKLLYKNRQYGK